MPKNPFYADRIVLKNGGVIETSAGTDIIAVSSAGAVTLDSGDITEALLTGFVASAGTVAATDSVLEAFNKTAANVVALQGTAVGGALTDTHMMVGNGSNVAADVAISGDATMANTGALTVTGSTGAFAVGTTFTTGSTTATTGAGAVAITGMIHEVTTSGIGDALTLADGAEGQHLTVVYIAEGGGTDTAICTPSNLAGANTTVTFNDLGDSAHLLFTAGTWFFLGGEAVVA